MAFDVVGSIRTRVPHGDRLFGTYGGLIVAAVGFTLSRVFLAEAVVFAIEPIRIVATTGSLVVGLAVSVAGVALFVGAFEPAYVADLTRGCLAGCGSVILALAVATVATGSELFQTSTTTWIFAMNVVLAGAIVGLFAGRYQASARSQTETIRRGVNRERFINRLLRHEVLNAATIIDGHAELLSDEQRDRADSIEAIRNGAARIESTVHGVGTLAKDRDGEPTSVGAAIDDAVDDSAFAYAVDREQERPDATVSVDADDRLSLVFERLIAHAVDVRDADRVSIDVAADRHTVAVTITDDGAAISTRQRAILEHESFPEYDTPESSFLLQVASLLVGEYGGTVRVQGDTGLTVRLRPSERDRVSSTVGIATGDLYRAGVASVAAGLLMGGVYVSVGEPVFPVIGGLYGVDHGAVGWVTHLFHSVVFGLLFVAGVSALRTREWGGPFANVHLERLPYVMLAGLLWGTVLWLVAAGILMPLWLRTVGIPASLPTLPPLGLIAHGFWGATFAIGYRAVGGRFDGVSWPERSS